MKYMILTQASQLDYDAMGGKGSPEQPAWAPEDFAALGAFMEAFNQRLEESGELVETRALAPPVHTRRIQLQGGVPVTTDGPYAETHEVLAGYWIVECASFDRATEIAAELANCPAPIGGRAPFADVRPSSSRASNLRCDPPTVTDHELEGLLRSLTPQVFGAVVRRYGHFDLAEDATREALVAAATTWPANGYPDNPKAWLITVASRCLTDLLRAEQARRRREDAAAASVVPPSSGPAIEGHDTLPLLFMCCHPSLAPASQIALTLRAVGGLTTDEIARAFLVPVDTMTRRITRAKQTIKDSGVPFRMPPQPELDERLGAVLHGLYLIFNGAMPAPREPLCTGPISRRRRSASRASSIGCCLTTARCARCWHSCC